MILLAFSGTNSSGCLRIHGFQECLEPADVTPSQLPFGTKDRLTETFRYRSIGLLQVRWLSVSRWLAATGCLGRLDSSITKPAPLIRHPVARLFVTCDTCSRHQTFSCATARCAYGRHGIRGLARQVTARRPHDLTTTGFLAGPSVSLLVTSEPTSRPRTVTQSTHESVAPSEVFSRLVHST